jgi:hypothetical protein
MKYVTVFNGAVLNLQYVQCTDRGIVLGKRYIQSSYNSMVESNTGVNLSGADGWNIDRSRLLCDRGLR